MDINDSEFLPPDQVTNGQNLSMDVFYKTAANTTVRFKDGQILKFNKAGLVSIVKSRILHQIFYGDLRAKETKIEDFDYDTFKSFLDFIMGYKKLNFEHALKVFAVFHKYQVEHFMSQCIESLVPNVLNEKVCDALNMAAFYTCDELIEKLNKFLASKNIPEFLEDKNYFKLLQPDAWKIILNSVTIDSGLLIILAKWGKHYIEENSLTFETSRHFFEKHDLLKYFKLEYFETTGAISEFCSLEAGKDIFIFEAVLFHLYNSKAILHRKSKWINVNKNDIISERILMPNVKPFISKCGQRFFMQVKVKRNEAVFYHEQLPDGEKQIEELENKIFCEIKFNECCRGYGWYKETYKFSERDFVFHKTNYECFRPCDNCNDDASFNAYFDITWKFLQKSRVLLTTREGDELNKDKYFFTKDILACF